MTRSLPWLSTATGGVLIGDGGGLLVGLFVVFGVWCILLGFGRFADR